MKRESIVKLLATKRLIAILRGDMKGRELEIVEVLEGAGIAAIEMSIVSRDFDAALARIASAFGSRIAIGAGTILSGEDLNRAIAAGASFVVSPDGNRDVIEATLRAGLVSLPGALTVTEIVQAQRWGADAVKLFPAGAVGPGYVRAVRAPFPEVRLVPTGGVRVEDLAAYWAAGAWAVGVGSELVNAARIAEPGLTELQAVARAFAAGAETSCHDAE